MIELNILTGYEFLTVMLPAFAVIGIFGLIYKKQGMAKLLYEF